MLDLGIQSAPTTMAVRTNQQDDHASDRTVGRAQKADLIADALKTSFDALRLWRACCGILIRLAIPVFIACMVVFRIPTKER
jgi:hypothetical protein